MSEQRALDAAPNRFAQGLFAGLPRRYDLLAEVLSFGQNGRWRRAMVDAVVAADPDRVLDVATGTAGVALQLATRTRAHVVGVDLSAPMLREGARRVAERDRTGRVDLVVGRAESLPFPDGAFDALTFTYLLRYVADPASTVRELARVLAPGAPMASLDFGVPGHPLPRTAWRAYTRVGLPVGGLAGGRDWVRVGRFLGPNIEEHYRRHPVAAIVGLWEAAGMTDVHARPMSLGGGLVMWGRKRDD